MRIGIDIDGVINDLETYHVTYGSRFCFEKGISFQLKQEEYELTAMYQWDETTEKKFYEEYYYTFLTSSDFIKMHVKEVLMKLHQRHEIFIITARLESDVPAGINMSMYDITKQWLIENEVLFHKLTFSASDKTQDIQRYNINLMIEDNPEFLKQADGLSIPFICFDASYNRIKMPANVIRVHNWYEILHFIDSIDAEEKK